MLITIWQKLKDFFIVNRKIRLSGVAAIFLIVIIGVSLVPRPAEASWLIDIGADTIAKVLSYVFLWIASLIGKVLVLMIGVLIDIVQYNGFNDSLAVTKGWVVVRDVCNMFFVLVLLVIAFGTILRIENYKYNRLLSKLIIMAILVNFSRLIAGFFIDISQVVMLTFVSAFADASSHNFTSIFQLREMLAFVPPEGAPGQPKITAPSDFEQVAIPLFAAIMMLIACMTMIAMVVVFLMRIIMLWILVVLSPLAYMLATLPIGQKYSSQWWSTFGKWVTTGPVLAFFLWLALAVLPSGSSEIVTPTGEETSQFTGVGTDPTSVTAAHATTSSGILSFMLSIGMLVVALSTAGALGGVAGSFAGNMLSRVKRMGAAPVKAVAGGIKTGGKAIAGWGQEMLSAATGIELSPTAWKEGWQKHRKRTRGERKDRMRQKAAGRGGLLGALSTPEHFADQYWGAAGVKRMFKEGIGGGRYKKKKQQADETEKRQQAVKEKQEQYESMASMPTVEEAERELGRLTNERIRLGSGQDVEFDVAEIQPHVTEKVNGLDSEIKNLREHALKEVEESLESLPQEAKDEENEIYMRLTDKKNSIESEIAGKQKEKLELKDSLETAINRGQPMVVSHRWSFAEEQKDRLNSRIEKIKEQRDNNELPENAQVQEELRHQAIILASQNEELAKQVTDQKKEADSIRPAVNYAMRRDQSLAISKEKSEMLTDSWQELWSIYEDAKKHGDLIRASAAYLKAAEYANDNEFQNMAGDSSDAKGMKSFIMNEFVGKKGLSKKRLKEFEEEHGIKIEEEGMGMSEEQALNVANLVSYQAEKVGHWGLARAVGVKDGKQYWQKENDRLFEVMAEVRKQDFEVFMRRVNRLGWGAETPIGDTRQERANNFHKTGDRKYKNSPFALAFVKENWDKFESLLKRSRFNPNIAINLTSGDNFNELLKIAEDIPQSKKTEEGRNIKEIITWIKDFGSAQKDGDPFADLKQILERRSASPNDVIE